MANDTFKMDAAERVNSALKGERSCGLMSEYLMITAAGAPLSDGRCANSTANEHLPGLEIASDAAPERRPTPELRPTPERSPINDRLPVDKASSERPIRNEEEVGRIVSSSQEAMDRQRPRSENNVSGRRPADRPNNGPVSQESHSSPPRESEYIDMWESVWPPRYPVTTKTEGPQQVSPEK